MHMGWEGTRLVTYVRHLFSRHSAPAPQRLLHARPFSRPRNKRDWREYFAVTAYYLCLPCAYGRGHDHRVHSERAQSRRAHDLKLSGVLQVGLVIWFPISVYTMSDNRNVHVKGNLMVLSEMCAFISWPSLSLKCGPCREDV